MTAFAFILGVVPLLTASGAGAESRKVMGMTVFFGMLIATILGVCLIPMLYVVVGKVIGGGAKHVRCRRRATRRRQPRRQPRGATDVLRRASISRLAAPVGAALMFTGCTLGPDYKRPEMPTPGQYRFVTNAAEAQSMADLPWWEVFEDEILQALIREATVNNLDLRVAVARVEEARARAGIAKSFMYPQVDGVASYGVRQASDARSTAAGENADTDAPER